MLPVGCEPLCNSCHHRSLSMAESLLQKETFIRERLERWQAVFQPIVSVREKERLGYRQKVLMAAGYSDGHWIFGTRRRDELIPIPDCPVHAPYVNAVLRRLGSILPPPESFPLAAVSLSGRQLTLVVKSGTLPDVSSFQPSLSEFPDTSPAEGFWIHLFPSTGRKVFGKGNWRLICGKPDSVDGRGLRYGPAAFSQPIPALADELLKEAREFLQPGKNSLVADLYCGNGFSLKKWEGALSRIGVEMFGEPVKFARLNVPGAMVLQGHCSDRIPQLNAWATTYQLAERLLFVNPPRTGLEREVTEWIHQVYQPVRIAYQSCSPGTLARDLQVLTLNGYRVTRITPYDFFPLTHHVECLVLLERIT